MNIMPLPYNLPFDQITISYSHWMIQARNQKGYIQLEVNDAILSKSCNNKTTVIYIHCQELNFIFKLVCYKITFSLARLNYFNTMLLLHLKIYIYK